MKNYRKNNLNVISLGAGKQSSYMLLTALRGAFKIKPDFAIFSDTGCEPYYVYDYVRWLQSEVKRIYNFDIIIVKAKEGNLMQNTIDYLDGKIKRVASLPLRLENNSGLIMRQCTNDYKIRPVRKYLQSVRNKKKVDLWIGISLDEIERMKPSNVKYINNIHPLIENRKSLDNIKYWYQSNKIPEPGKSACLICPFHSDNYWTALKELYPNEFQKACDFDEKIRIYPNLKKKTY